VVVPEPVRPGDDPPDARAARRAGVLRLAGSRPDAGGIYPRKLTQRLLPPTPTRQRGVGQGDERALRAHARSANVVMTRSSSAGAMASPRARDGRCTSAGMLSSPTGTGPRIGSGSRRTALGWVMLIMSAGRKSAHATSAMRSAALSTPGSTG